MVPFVAKEWGTKNGSKPIILGENKFADCGVMKRNHP